MQPATRVLFNTGVLYVRLIIGTVIGLFTTRLILGALGETNYGIYALVAGVVGMLGILNASMTNASMRFMAHSLGSGIMETIKKTFNTTLFLHLVIGIFVVMIMEIGGMLMFEYLLNIPEAKIFDAKIVFHFMVATTFIIIISVPYDAVMNSHENILALSMADLFANILKLGIAVYLSYSKANLLILYGFLMFMTEVVLRIIKQWYSRLKYEECKINFKIYIDKGFAKTILSFSGWNLFGSIAAISVTQVKSVFLNMFFGVSVNAADGISKTASGQVNMISVSMTQALNPQLVKSEGGGNRQKMIRFTEMATKFSVFLFAIFAIPIILETPYLLNLWLKNVPEYAIIFCQLILISLLLEKFTFEITSAIRAVGIIRNFQVAETILLVINIPIYYVVLSMGYPPYSVFLVSIFISFLGAFIRLYYGRTVVGMSIQSFLRNGISPVLIPVFLATMFALAPHLYLPEGFLRLCITTITSLIVMTSALWFFGIKKDEATIIKQFVITILQKVFFINKR